MEVLITRNWSKIAYTIGKFFINGKLMANTIEMPSGSGYGRPQCGERIAAGRYVITHRYSPSQKRDSLWVCKVGDSNFNRRYILIHVANSVKDIAGCIGVGWNTSVGWLSDSRKTLEQIEAVIRKAFDKGEIVNLTIRS